MCEFNISRHRRWLPLLCDSSRCEWSSFGKMIWLPWRVYFGSSPKMCRTGYSSNLLQLLFGVFFFLQRMPNPMQMMLKLCQELYVELSDFTIVSTLYLGCCQVHLQLSQMLHEDTIMSSNLLHQQRLALPVSISCNTLVASFTNVKILKN